MKKPIARSDLSFAPFEVVVVPFPYTDRLAEKRRPAIVISAPGLQKRHGLVWLAMVTSAANPAWHFDVMIADLESAALPAPSRVRPAKIATVDAARILHRIGRLSRTDATAVRTNLRRLAAV